MKSTLRSVFPFLVLAFVLGWAGTPVAGAERKLTIEDYFLRIPPGPYFEVPAKGLLELLHSPRYGVLDIPNGFIRCNGDGAQTSIEVALFRFKDGHALIAITSGILEVADYTTLQFFEEKGATLRPVSRSIFPVPEGGNREFDLPRHGRTVIVRNSHGKILHRVTWTGEKFEEEK